MNTTRHAMIRRELIAGEQQPVHERHPLIVTQTRAPRNRRRDDLNHIGVRIGPARGSLVRYSIPLEVCAKTQHYDPEGYIRLHAWGNGTRNLWVCQGCGDRWQRATVAAPGTPPEPPEEHLWNSRRLLPGMVVGVHIIYQTREERRNQRGQANPPGSASSSSSTAPRGTAPMTPANPVTIRMDTDSDLELL